MYYKIWYAAWLSWSLSSASASYFRSKHLAQDLLPRWWTIPKETLCEPNNNTDRDVSQSCPSAPTVWYFVAQTPGKPVKQAVGTLCKADGGDRSDGLYRPNPYLHKEGGWGVKKGLSICLFQHQHHRQSDPVTGQSRPFGQQREKIQQVPAHNTSKHAFQLLFQSKLLQLRPRLS